MIKLNFSNITILISIIIGFFIILFREFHYHNYESSYFLLQGRVILLITYALCSFPIIIYIFKQEYLDFIPLFPLTCLYFLTCYISLFFSILFFGTEILLGEYTIFEYKNALEILFIGIISFFVGFILSMICFKKMVRKEIKILSFNIFEVFLFGTFLMLGVIIFYYIIEIQKLIPALSQIKYPLLMLGNGLLFKYFIFCENKKKNLFKLILVILLILIPICFEFISGSYAFPFIQLLLMYVFYIYLKKKINIIPFILIALIFIFIHAGKYSYRTITWKYDDTSFTKINLSKIFFKTYKQLLFNKVDPGPNDTNLFKNRNKQSIQRVFHSAESLIIVSKLSPAIVPYWEGYSYKILLTKFIPRIFWKNKPSDILGNEFGHRYKILNNDSFNEFGGYKTVEDRHTSWNMPVLNEFYVNFGKKGTLFGMLLIGLLFGLITKLFSITNKLNVESTISFYIFVPLFFLESHLSLLFGAIVQSYIFLMLISFIFIFLYRKLITL